MTRHDEQVTSRQLAVQRRVQKHLLNPGMRAAIQAGLVPRMFALVETTGRRTGRPRRTPVTVTRDGRAVWLVAEHGRESGYVRNIAASPRVRVMIGRRWLAGTAALLDSDDAWARRREIDRSHGWMGRADGAIFRAAAGTPLTIRVDLDR